MPAGISPDSRDSPAPCRQSSACRRLKPGAPMRDLTRNFLPALWALTKPFWFSEERWAARGLLAVIVALNLGLVYINVLLNQWNNDFYNTLQNMDKIAFFDQLLKFTVIAAAYIVVAV